MRELTQTCMYPNGNCWQTAVACVLDLDPEVLPAQAKHDHKWTNTRGDRLNGPFFANSLGRYLRKHHGLFYMELDVSTWSSALEPKGLHFLVGKTVRSAAQGGCTHIVVAEHGKTIWDPHPSRAGLLEPAIFSALVPFPPEYVEYWERSEKGCPCPACDPSLAKCGCPECSP